MRFSCSALVGLVLVSSAQTAAAFTGGIGGTSLRTVPSSSTAFLPKQHRRAFGGALNNNNNSKLSASSLQMSYKVGIVGATGAVGKEILQCMETRGFPASQMRIFGSTRSAGSVVESSVFGSITVELFDVAAARECDLVFLAVSGDFAKEHAHAISEGDDGAVVIDNSSAFRYKPEIPLVVPEINPDATKCSKLIANPNCTTAIGVMALWPLHKLFKIKRILMSTYQAASGAGQEGMDELRQGTKSILDGEREVAENKIFAHPLPFNVIPHIDTFQENGYTKEEMKVTWETRKICGLADDFPIR